MKEIKQKLKHAIEEMEGHVLVIGNCDDAILKWIQKNNAITSCDYLNEIEKGISQKKKEKGKKRKTIRMKKLRKSFSKKRIHSIICDTKCMIPYLKYFIRDSVYITQKNIFYIGPKEDIDYDLLIHRYHRYQVSIEETISHHEALIQINVERARNHWLPDKIYFLGDTVLSIVDMFSEFLLK